MIQLAPCALVFMRALRLSGALRSEQVIEREGISHRRVQIGRIGLGFQLLYQTPIGGCVIQITHHQQMGMATTPIKRIARPPHITGRIQPKRLTLQLTAGAGGEMTDKHIQRIAGSDTPPHMQQRATPLLPASKRDPQRLISHQSKLIPLIEQGYPDASRIVGITTYIFIGLGTQRGMVTKLIKGRIILHLTQANQGGFRPFAGRRDDLRYLLQLVMIPLGCPTALALRQELRIIRQGIVLRVEKVLYIITDHPKQLLPIGRWYPYKGTQHEQHQPESHHGCFASSASFGTNS